MTSSRGVLPQDDLYRAVYALPSAPGDAAKRAVTQLSTGTGRTLDLQWYVADQWTEINSAYEGHFMERVAPGAAAKTIKENQASMRILLQHGRDPHLGSKPIAAIEDVGENGVGGYARGELFPSLDPLVLDGLRAGQYGASFRFSVIRDDLVTKPEKSDYNPNGLPERTIREMRVSEFGPVTWGAYPAASAGVRSITDEIHFAGLASMPAHRLVELVNFTRERDSERVDSEDLECIAQMILCGTEYVDGQDEDDPQSNIDTMNEVLTLLSTLVEVETAEVEPVEPAAEGEASAPDSNNEDESRRSEDEVPAAPVEAPARRATPATGDKYLGQKGRKHPYWQLSPRKK